MNAPGACAACNLQSRTRRGNDRPFTARRTGAEVKTGRQMAFMGRGKAVGHPPIQLCGRTPCRRHTDRTPSDTSAQINPPSDQTETSPSSPRLRRSSANRSFLSAGRSFTAGAMDSKNVLISGKSKSIAVSNYAKSLCRDLTEKVTGRDYRVSRRPVCRDFIYEPSLAVDPTKPHA